MYAIINSNIAVLRDVIRCTVAIISQDSITYIGTLSTLKPLRNAATKLCDVTSQTHFKVSAMRPTNINFRRFVLGK